MQQALGVRTHHWYTRGVPLRSPTSRGRPREWHRLPRRPERTPCHVWTPAQREGQGQGRHRGLLGAQEMCTGTSSSSRSRRQDGGMEWVPAGPAHGRATRPLSWCTRGAPWEPWVQGHTWKAWQAGTGEKRGKFPGRQAGKWRRWWSSGDPRRQRTAATSRTSGLWTRQR